jgi:hypothetical protein
VLTTTDTGDAIMLDVQPASVLSWLRNTDPVTVPVICDHATAPCGHFLSFHRSTDRILCTCTVADTPAGSLLLRGVDDGTCPAFSFAAKIVRSYDSGNRLRGLPLWVAEEITITEHHVRHEVILTPRFQSPPTRTPRKLAAPTRTAFGNRDDNRLAKRLGARPVVFSSSRGTASAVR